jgi:gliding motility-associated lipoprotein GldK
MKRLSSLCLILSVVILGGCGLLSSSTNGELTGVQGRKKFFEPDPYNMVYVEAGSYTMGSGDADMAWRQNVMSRTVSVGAFWMDQTEITNNQYRQFVFWVRDSIMRRTLANAGIDGFLLQGDDYDDLPDDQRPLNWKTRIDSRRNADQKEALEELYLSVEERFYGFKEFDTRKLMYEYMWVDLQQAAAPRNRYNYQTQTYTGWVTNPQGERIDVRDRSSMIFRDRVHAYPDTLVWISDFSYSYNEPMANMYFWHPGYDNYPVVGVNWKQATAFCVWRSNLLAQAMAENKNPKVHNFRLPLESEWEFAARGGLSHGTYPWGGPYTRNQEGCFLANFKPGRGNYTDDGAHLTQRVASYMPNEYGLYDMAGNVSEWTASAYDESSYRFVHDLNPDYRYNVRPDDPPTMKRKVVRGGSWKDVEYFLRVNVRDYEYLDTATSWIGFRCVRPYIGSTSR